MKLCQKCNKLLKLKRFRPFSKICENCRNNKYYSKINDKKRDNYDPNKKRVYYLKHKEFIKARTCKRHIERRKEDILYKLADSIRSRTKKSLNHKSWKKTTKFYEYIGCNLIELKTHLESQFKNNMSWKNYGEWHIDHIIPLSSAKTKEELYKLCHYTNLQPLWAIDNLRKGNRISNS